MAAYDEADVERLWADPGIIRNRRTTLATVTSAAATVELRGDGGLPELVWRHMPATTPVPRAQGEVPLVTAASLALARDLRRRGFTLVGPGTMLALMAAAGVVDHHLVGSHRRGCSGLWSPSGRRRCRPVLS